MDLLPDAVPVDSPESGPFVKAARGPLVVSNVNQAGETTLLAGSTRFRSGLMKSDAVVVAANEHLAIVRANGESLLWPYRQLASPFQVGAGHLTAIANDSDIILEEVKSRSHKLIGLNALSFRGGKPLHLPFQLGGLRDAAKRMRGVGIDGEGNALVEVSSGTGGEVRKIFTGGFDRRMRALAAYMEGLSSGNTPSEWYVVRRSQGPVQLQNPDRSLGVIVSAIRSPGRAVGAVIIGKGSNVRSIPCWWDLRGQIHELALPNDVNFGIATDAALNGAIVGVVGNEITSYAALWPTVLSQAQNINRMLPRNSDHELRWIDSVGSDFSMVALAQPKQNPDQSVLVGLSPR
jgi:hypothetical protein